MNIVTKAAGVVLAATALCGIGASAAYAATPTGHPSSQVGAPKDSQGFHIYNDTTTPMTLKEIDGDGNSKASRTSGR